MILKIKNKIKLSISDLWVNSHDRLSDFHASSWQRGQSPVPFLVIRLILASMAIAILTWSLVEGASPYWPIFLTNWGVLLVSILMLSGIAVSFIALTKKSLETTRLPWYVATYWFIFNVTVTLSLMITALYWLLLFDPEERNEKGERAFYLDVATHGITSCVAFMELLLSRTPVRLLHVYQPLGLGLIYAIFTGVYYAAGGTDSEGNRFIYSVLNWHENPANAGIVLSASVAALIILYLLIWAVAQCRDKFTLLVVRTTSHDFPPTPPDKHTRMV